MPSSLLIPSLYSPAKYGKSAISSSPFALMKPSFIALPTRPPRYAISAILATSANGLTPNNTSRFFNVCCVISRRLIQSQSKWNAWQEGIITDWHHWSGPPRKLGTTKTPIVASISTTSQDGYHQRQLGRTCLRLPLCAQHRAYASSSTDQPKVMSQFLTSCATAHHHHTPSTRFFHICAP